MIKAFLLALALAVSLAGAAVAGPYEDGDAAFYKGDDAQAVSWFRQAADQGHVVAQFRLGEMYDLGLGVRKDYAQAVAWYRKAADQGNGLAQYNLGDMYYLGHGVPQDFIQAHMWFNLSAARDAGDFARKQRDIVAAKMTSAQIAEAQRLASAWKPK